MRAFTQLFLELERRSRTTEKVAAMRDYFLEARPKDAAWAVYFLSGRKLKRVTTAQLLRAHAARVSGYRDWLVDASHDAVGDMTETIALMLPPAKRQTDRPLAEWITQRFIPLRQLDAEGQFHAIAAAWAELGSSERLVWNKLLTGTFRVGVARQLVSRALAEVVGVRPDVMEHRLTGDWSPTSQFFSALLQTDTDDTDVSRPYPFQLAWPLESDVETLGDRMRWLVDWKWNGIRAQLISRDGQTFLWARGDELVTDRFPEIAAAAESLPDGVAIDGEILAWADGTVLGFGELQRRVGRGKVSAKLVREAPVVFFAFDLLEYEHGDIRYRALLSRRALLVEVLERLDARARARIVLTPAVNASSWAEVATRRSEARSHGAEGLVLKRLESPYAIGRQRGSWWKWKTDPLTIDAVLLYAERGQGSSAERYTSYTFAVWSEGDLVPFAKTRAGLTDDEVEEVDRFVRANTREQFGPVRSVVPELVFELAFEGVERSSRHKSGITVRSPRIVRRRKDKRPEDADSLDTIGAMLEALENPRSGES